MHIYQYKILFFSCVSFFFHSVSKICVWNYSQWFPPLWKLWIFWHQIKNKLDTIVTKKKLGKLLICVLKIKFLCFSLLLLIKSKQSSPVKMFTKRTLRLEMCPQEAHMEDYEAKCVAPLNKDFTYLLNLLTYLLTQMPTLFHLCNRIFRQTDGQGQI